MLSLANNEDLGISDFSDFTDWSSPAFSSAGLLADVALSLSWTN
jgi:hypothetical protein